MLINMIGQLNAIAQMNDAQMMGMRARQSQISLMNSLDHDKLDLSTLHKIHNKDKQLTFAGVKSNFVAKAMDTWYNSLKEQQNKRIEEQFSTFKN